MKATRQNWNTDQVKDFKVWGSYMSADGDCTNEIKRVKRRIAMARQKAVELTTIWKDKNVTSALKFRVMKWMVWAVSVWCRGMGIKEMG